MRKGYKVQVFCMKENQIAFLLLRYLTLLLSSVEYNDHRDNQYDVNRVFCGRDVISVCLVCIMNSRVVCVSKEVVDENFGFACEISEKVCNRQR